MSDSTSPDVALTLWLQSLDLPSYGPPERGTDKKVLNSLGDVVDGEILWQVLATLDSTFFRAPRPSSMSGALSEAWVLRFTSFKKMYKLVVRYFEEELRKSLKSFQPAPNLQKIAKDGDIDESVRLCLLILTLATLVQPDVHVPIMQALPTAAQTALMVGIESVNRQLISLESIRSPARETGRSADPNGQGTELNAPLSGRSFSETGSREEESKLLEQIRNLEIEKENLQASNDNLQSELKHLSKSHQDHIHKLFMAEQDLKTTQEELRNLQEERDSARRATFDHGDDEEDKQIDRQSRQDYLLRSELDRVKIELTDVGAKLDQSEALNERQTTQIEDLRKKLDELGDVEEQNRGLRDQLDEVRHETERARKLENVIEKYKKKLDESADLRRQLKTLEDQNCDLLDRNTSLEDEYRKVAAFKPLMEQYKSQIASLESQLSSQKRETDRLQYVLDTTIVKLQEAEDERDRGGEELALFEERVKELEEENPTRLTRRRKKNIEGDDSGGGDDSGFIDASFERHIEEETGIIHGIGGELNDAIEGRTMTSLKLELRKLKRELKALKSAQEDEDEGAEGTFGGGKKSRYLVLENLLEDANRMKKKYEDDYLKQYRETLILSNQLEEIRSGKSSHGDGAESTIALRQRLNETVEELEKLRAHHTELTVAFEQLNNELTLAKSDLHLVGKDQIEILSSLRDSVSTEKVLLSNEIERLKREQGALRDQLTMKTEQIQSLLLEKINLQSDSIDQRERMLLREQEMSGHMKSPPPGETIEIDPTRLAVVEQLCKEKDEECRILKGKLDKAKLFIMNQDKLYKESIAGRGNEMPPVDVSSLAGNFDTEQSMRSEISLLKDALERYKTQVIEVQARYEKEFRLMGSAWHNLSQQRLRETIALNRSDLPNHSAMANGTANPTFGGQLRPQSWVKQQRGRMMTQFALRP